MTVEATLGGGNAMSRLFGEMRQIGYVVRDIEAAMLAGGP